MKNILILMAISLSSLTALSQSVNEYKYVIVPEKYDFLSAKDQYQLNSLTKFLFNKYGFESYMAEKDTLPNNISGNSCSVLSAKVSDVSKFLKTKVQVELINCHGKIIFVSDIGESKLKNYKSAYHEALRKAFVSIENLNYAFGRSVNTTQSGNQVKDAKENSMASVSSTNVPILDKAVNFETADGTFRAVIMVDTITFYEKDKSIGKGRIEDADSNFEVVTSEFTGNGYFLDSKLIVERKIKGLSDLIKMIFIRK